MTPWPGTNKKRNYEVYFPNTHVSYDPCGPLSFPVSILCHATHDNEAEKIQGDDYNLFTPHKKTGKSYRLHYSESYCCTVQTPDPDKECYKPIPPTTQIFPGYYSWWGLVVEKELCPSWIESRVLPHYLKTPSESVYGRNAFLYDFKDLLKSYAKNRGCKVDKIHLLVGGTLRYKCEIGYVIIICTSDDPEIVKKYPSITQSEVFDSDGLVDEDGKIDDFHQDLHFTTHHVNTYFSYETLNFAFYFSSGSMEFQCDHVAPRRIKHDYCMRFGTRCSEK